MDSDELMSMFEDLSQPLKRLVLPPIIEVVPVILPQSSNQNEDRTRCGKDYSIEEKRNLESKLTQTFAKANLNMSLTRMTSVLDSSCSRSDLNTTTTRASENTIKFAPNNHRSDLLIYDYRDDIVHHINECPVLFITGKTGCGKTTQVPQYIYDHWKAQSEKKSGKASYCNILVSQPRKIAAITIAQRVADERKSTVGDLVGYQVGLKKELNQLERDQTKILFCTTGVVLQRLIHEKSMSHYSHIIIDEIHERDINTDLLLIIVRRLLEVDGLKTKIILMSATMDVNHFLNFFKIPLSNGTDFYPPIIDLLYSKRNFKIREFFLDDFSYLNISNACVKADEPGISDEMYETAFRIVEVCVRQMKTMREFKAFENGTILVFLPGINEIEIFYNKYKTMAERCASRFGPITICILHSSLSSEEQCNALKPGSTTKIILSTNIAESSLTIPNVTHVVDFCLTKYQSVAKGALLSSLILNWTSKQNSKQRAGRCGRMCDGNVIRLVTKSFYNKIMLEYPAPEMTRVSLESVILKIKVFGLGLPKKMLALAPDPPDLSSIVDSVLHLKELGALSKFDAAGNFDYEDGDLTFLGRVMEALPVDPRIAKFIVIGYLYSVLEEAIIIGAGLNIKSIFTNKFGEKMLNYSRKLSWSYKSGSDCMAIFYAYTLWNDHNSMTTSAPISEKAIWCKSHGLDHKNLSEMSLLIKEIKNRLINFGIFLLPDQPTWIQAERNFILKICMAGAFGPSHFFKPTQHERSSEREAFKCVNNHDPLRTVIFRNMDCNFVGDVYKEQLREAMIANRIIEEDTEVKITFNYLTSEKILVEFTRQQDEEEGKILREVYKAVKFRQVDSKIFLNVMSKVDTMDWAQKHGVGVFNKESGLFEMKKKFLAAPGLFVQPTMSTKSMEGVVTHIENANKFFFKPRKAIHEVDEGTVEDKRYEANIRRVQTMIAVAEKKKIDESVSGDKMLALKVDEKWCRAFFIAMKSSRELHIKLIDRGCEITADIDEIYTIEDESIGEELMKYPPRVFECTLAHITPAIMNSRDRKWTEKSTRIFRDHVLNQRATVEIFSVVNNIVSVKLFVDGVNVNSNLIKKQYADECEEHYLSVLDNDDRQSRLKIEVKPEEEFAFKEWKDFICPSPPMTLCSLPIKLKGPHSPLEVELNGVSRFCQAKVMVDKTSINSVILEDDLTSNHTKFYVACDVTVNKTSKTLVLRDVTMMPATPGLAVLLALIFSPAAELRREVKHKSRYVSLLTGLGCNEKLKPYYEEHDASFDIDFKLDENDIDNINQLRHEMSKMLQADEGKDYVDLIDDDKVLTLTNIQELIRLILAKKRPFRAIDSPPNNFDWGVDRIRSNENKNPLRKQEIFITYNFPRLHELPDEAKKELKIHADELNKATKGSMTIRKKFCRFCGYTWENLVDLKFHLRSKKHLNCVEDLLD